MNDPSPSVSERTGGQRPDERTAPVLQVASVPPAIQCDHVSASYRVHLDGGWRAGLSDLFRRTRTSDRIIPAVNDVTFDVPRGSVMGIVGRNGAGKSTLLRTISGVLHPDEGQVTVRGRISSLAMGLGFNTRLTGRANIRLGGLAIGLTPDELDAIEDEIGEFAQLGPYLDLPVSTYSSGMQMRLAFAVASHLDPEVLLIDEALIGGDTKFVEQTAWKLHELCGGGRTIVLVTHSLSAVRNMATEAMWMHEGRVVEYGEPDEVVAKYMRYCRLQASDLDWDGM
jgi:ABC-type polysaccharide/polyol phosphate transport system ATPase subunit